jgi:hypothetical protein
MTTKNRHPAKRAPKARPAARSLSTDEEPEAAKTRHTPAKTARHRSSEHPHSVNRPRSAGEPTEHKPRAHAPAPQKGQTTKLVLKALGENRDIYKDLPLKSRAPMRRAMQQIADLLIQSTHLQTAGEAATFEQRAQTAVDTLRVIALGDSRQLQSVIEALEPITPEDPGTVDLEEAEARGRLRLQALYRKIVTDSYSVADLRAEWGITRQRLAQLRQEDRLFAISVPFHRGMLYPRWQFGVDQRPRPIMPNLIKQAKSVGLDAIGFHQLMTNPASGSGTSLVQMLNYGQEELVIGIIRASGT